MHSLCLSPTHTHAQGVSILRNITFEMAMREHMVVLGGAGAGKSCLGMCMVHRVCVCFVCVCERKRDWERVHGCVPMSFTR